MVAASILRCTRRYLNLTLPARVRVPESACGFHNALLTSIGARSVFAVLMCLGETEPFFDYRCRCNQAFLTSLGSGHLITSGSTCRRLISHTLRSCSYSDPSDFDSKRLTNTSVRRLGSVLKHLVEPTMDAHFHPIVGRTSDAARYVVIRRSLGRKGEEPLSHRGGVQPIGSNLA